MMPDAMHGHDDRNVAASKAMRCAALASLSVSLFLVAIKFLAFIATNSVALLASLADSGLDVFTSAINLFAVQTALRPADDEHRFGHGKAEPLAGLAQFAFIAGSATFLVIQSVQRLLAPQPVAQPVIGLVVMGVAIVAASGLVLFQKRVVAQTGSLAIGADRMHYLGDLVTNLGAALAIVLAVWMRWKLADPVIGILIALYLAWNAWGVFEQSYDQLMDRELPDDERARIKSIVLQHREVKDLHELRTRAAGTGRFIQLHIELDPAISLMRAHEISDAVEAELCAAFPKAEVMIHQDPAGLEPLAPPF